MTCGKTFNRKMNKKLHYASFKYGLLNFFPKQNIYINKRRHIQDSKFLQKILRIMVDSRKILFIYLSLVTEQIFSQSESKLKIYQENFKNKTLNLVTGLKGEFKSIQSSIKDFAKQNSINLTEFKSHNHFDGHLKNENQEISISHGTASLTIESENKIFLQKMPFNLEESFFNISYLVFNGSLDYFEVENETQIVELPLKLTTVESTSYLESKLWILLPHGPSTRRSLVNLAQGVNNSFIDLVKTSFKPEKVHVQVPVFHASSVYGENNGAKLMEVKLKNDTSNSGDSELNEVDKWFEADKPFLFIVFSKDNEIITIGHFCNPGPAKLTPKNKLRDIGYN